MTVRFANDFFLQYKKADVRIRNKTDDCLRIFKKNPHDSRLNNHKLKKEWIGHRSINITSDWRAIYKEFKFADGIIVYFITLGTHNQLYKQEKKRWGKQN